MSVPEQISNEAIIKGLIMSNFTTPTTIDGKEYAVIVFGIRRFHCEIKEQCLTEIVDDLYSQLMKELYEIRSVA